MAIKQPIYIDLETHPIESRPAYPPKPVGVSIRWPGKKGVYHSWGHPTKNNTTLKAGQGAIQLAYQSGLSLCFHHGKFDLDVIQTHLGIAVPRHDRLHDTMLLAYLDDPYARSYGLKDLGVSKCGIEATERDELRDWIFTHIQGAKQKKSEWGRYICQAPGDLVGKYADGDTLRSKLLFEKLSPRVLKEMPEAYRRELELMPILLANEQHGIRVDVKALERDIKIYDKVLLDVENWIRKRLKAPDLELTKGADLADALEKAGKIHGGWVLTDKGSRSVAAEALELMLEDKPLLAALAYRAPLVTSLNTFMKVWFTQASQTGGLVFFQWNQIRDDQGYGTATGRMSTSPNWQNIPAEKRMRPLEKWAIPLLPKLLIPLPRVRRYVLPDSKDHVIIDRDYSSQEPRLLAHFEGDKLQAAYNEKPDLDMHQFVTDVIRDIGMLPDFSRDDGKDINLAQIYGQGIKHLARKLKRDESVVKRIRKIYFEQFPGVKELQDDMKYRESAKLPVRTLGSRLYYCEEPRFMKKYNRIQTFAYKLVNYLIQGSAADQTKQAIIEYDRMKDFGRWMLQVHDELAVSCPKAKVRGEMPLLKMAMETALEMDVPCLSEGSMGLNFHELKDYK